MARMIDADRLLRELTALSHGQVWPGWTYDGIRLLIERQPTLTQPNEPLTWEELEKLKNSPVYIDVIGVNSYWALVRDINDSGVWLMTVDDIDDYGSHCLYGKTWLAYRRQSEGEEEEKHVIKITENL